MPAIVKALHDLVESAHNLFLWTDASGKPTERYCEVYFPSVVEAAAQPLAGKTDLAWIATRGHDAGNLRHRPTQFFNTAFYTEVYHPMRARQSLDAVVRVEGKPVGMLVLHRDADIPFTDGEQRRLESVLPYLRLLWQRPPHMEMESFIQSDGADRGVIVTGAAGRVQYLSATAEQLLRMCALHVGFDPAQGAGRLPPPLRELCAQFAARTHAQSGRVPTLTFTNPWGRFVFRVFALQAPGIHDPQGSDLLGIAIERQEPLQLAIVRGFQQSTLSPKQRDIALMLALGKTADQVATQLGITSTTYRDHVQKIYEKMGVTQRADLIRTLTQPAAA
jgi:DNA-binding CsgD family transcriptional regulator